MKMFRAFVSLLVALPALAQTPEDLYMGDWQGTLTLGQDRRSVAVYMIPHGNGKYEARFVSDFAQRGPYLYRLKGEIREGQFKFLDDIPLEIGRVLGATGRGVELDASWWSGSVSGASASGRIGGRVNGSFELKHSERISPNLGAKPPAGAVVLFDGQNLDQWRNREEGKPITWKILPGGVVEVNGGGDIMSKQKFRDQKVHVEFRLPYMPTASGQGRGNSGVYLQGRYEVQVLDSYGLEGADNECGAIYTVSPPKVNMCAPPLQWQSYDITFTTAKFDADGKKVANPRITVVHNGVVVQDNTEVPRATAVAINVPENEPVGLLLQDHGNPVQYRNVWVVPQL